MRATFHLLDSLDEKHFCEAACKVASLAYDALPPGSTLLITAPESLLNTLDTLLWTFDTNRFLPHGIDDNKAPIQLSSHFKPAHTLINLTDNTPELGTSNHLHEIVGLSDAHKSSCREKFKHYKKSGFAVETLKRD